jgi:hypothetical protein
MNHLATRDFFSNNKSEGVPMINNAATPSLFAIVSSQQTEKKTTK